MAVEIGQERRQENHDPSSGLPNYNPLDDHQARKELEDTHRKLGFNSIRPKC